MSEHSISTPSGGERLVLPFQFSPEQTQALEGVGAAALRIVDARFSTGYPDFAGGDSPALDLAYHNGHHARQVGRDAGRVAEACGFSPAVRRLSQTSGEAHDLEQKLGAGFNEDESAAWLEAELRGRGFSEEAAAIGGLAIIGTKVRFENGQLVSQKATELEYPSKDAEQTALSVASGDLGVLYTPEGPYASHQLWREIQGVSPHEQPQFDAEKLAAFQQNQIALLDTFQYPLPQARAVLATHEPQVRAYSEQVHGQIVAGDITSWQQLIDQDLAFMRQNAA